MFWIVAVVCVVLVLIFGVVTVLLMRRNQEVVPDVADRHAAHTDRVVAVDDEGQPIKESQVPEEAEPRDTTAFENVLKEELDELHH
jgi:ABC-type bacteriocin/lantibiotic exporter with double-glycine peptidase domain